MESGAGLGRAHTPGHSGCVDGSRLAKARCLQAGILVDARIPAVRASTAPVVVQSGLLPLPLLPVAVAAGTLALP